MAEGFIIPYREGSVDRSLWDLTRDDASEELPEAIQAALLRLALHEQDIFEMRRNRVPQREIAREFGVTQVAVSYSLATIARKLKWILACPPRPDTLEEDLAKVGCQPQQIERVLLYLETLSFSETERRLGRNPHGGTVRTNFFRALARLPEGPTKSYLEHHRKPPHLTGLVYTKQSHTGKLYRLSQSSSPEGGPNPAQEPKSP